MTVPDTRVLQPNLLFIDDDAYMRRLMSARLERLGASVEALRTAPEALDYLETHRPDVIISDAVMPGLDGFALCRQLRTDSRFQAIPFIILTALKGDLRPRCLEAGADDYLSKLEDDVVFRLRGRLACALGLRVAALAGPPNPVGHASLMVVSASRVIHAQMASHLQQDDIFVRSALTLEEAFPLLQGSIPDILALDLAYGDREVLEWVTRVRALPGGEALPILILAAKGEDPGLVPLEALVQDRLPKPLDGQEGRHRVHLLLRIARM